MSENEFGDFPELTEEQLAASDHFIRGTEHPLMIQAKEKLKKVFEVCPVRFVSQGYSMSRKR